MASRYILNTDGTVQKYVEVTADNIEDLEDDAAEIGSIVLQDADDDEPAKNQNISNIYDATKTVNIDVSLGLLDDDEINVENQRLLGKVDKISSFGFKGGTDGKEIKSYKPFNSFNDIKEGDEIEAYTMEEVAV